jgi:hypothetical protein
LLEQQGKYIGFKIKKSGSYYSILPKQHLFIFFFIRVAAVAKNLVRDDHVQR